MTNSDVTMADAAFSSNIPSGWSGPVAGYLHSARAEHPWAPADWDKFGQYRKLPIFVATENGNDDGWNALTDLYQIGCPSGHVVAYDLEGRQDVTLVNGFFDVMHWAGFKVWIYGSLDTVLANPVCNGYWVADWTGQPHLVSHPAVRATQFQANIEPGYDLSVVRSWTLEEFWL